MVIDDGDDDDGDDELSPNPSTAKRNWLVKVSSKLKCSVDNHYNIFILFIFICGLGIG